MYKWAVYLNNTCSKEQPEAWSVVGKFKKRKNPNIFYRGADISEEMPIGVPRWETQNICLYFWTHRLSGTFSRCPSPDQNEGSASNHSTQSVSSIHQPFRQGLARSPSRAVKSGASHADRLQKATSSVLSISSKQFTWWVKSNRGGCGGDDDIQVWKAT